MSADVDLQLQPIEIGQLSQWAALVAAVSAADDDNDLYGEDDLRELFSDPDFDFCCGSCAAYDGPRMVGDCLLHIGASADPVDEMRIYGGVDPLYRGRGIGSGLLDWAEQAATRLHEARFAGHPLSLTAECLTRNTGAVDLLSEHGFNRSRWFHTMTCELGAGLPESPDPEGVEIVGFSTQRSSDAHLVRNESFRDHWGSTETTKESWAHNVASHTFRPQYSFIAYGPAHPTPAYGPAHPTPAYGPADGQSEPLGVVMSYEFAAQNEASGQRDLYIGIVGTRQAGRKRGIATALLTGALTAAMADGFDSATLGVDADSPTGTVGLYQRLGFGVRDTKITFTKVLIGQQEHDGHSPLRA